MQRAIVILAFLISLSSVNGLSQDTSYAALARLDYYTAEDYAEIAVFAPESKKDMRITVDLAFEFEFLVRGHMAFPGHMMPVRFSLARFHEGDNEVTVSFYEDEKWVDSRKVNVVLKKGSRNEVKVDRLTGGLVTDGLPFIPVGFYCSWPLEPAFPEEEVVKGFNLISPYWKIDKKGKKERMRFMDRCAGLGMKVNYNLCSVAGGGGNSTTRSEGLSRREKLELLRKEVELMRDHPALLAWYIADEPVGQGVPADSLEAAYDLIKALDPYHPVSIVFMAPHMAEPYREVMDITMTDPYPVPHGRIREVGSYVNELQDFFRHEKPVWLVPQAFGGNEWWTREPTAGEVRAMTYLGVVNGAAGIQYFIRKGLNAVPKSQATWGECGTIAQELMALTPALTSGQPAPPVETFSLDLHARAYNQSGMFTIVVVNSLNEPVEMELQLAGVDLTMEGVVMFEGRKISMKEGRIRDIMDGYGTRVYRFDNRMKPDWFRDIHPKNLAVDPSFENDLLPSVPASCYASAGSDRGATYWLDPRVSHHGDHSIRLHNPTPGAGVTLSFFGLELDPERSYTCSIWAKGEMATTDGKQKAQDFTMWLGKVSGGAEAKFTLSDAWVKYAFTTAGKDMVPSLAKWYSPQLRLDGKGTAWFDLLQVVPDLEMKNKRGEGGKGRAIELLANHDGMEIFYTLDGSAPTRASMPYVGPIHLDSSALMKAASFQGREMTGFLQARVTVHQASAARISYTHPYVKYTAGGDNGLVDGIMGSTHYKDGKWQGFHGTNAEFIINLGTEKEISRVSLTFLQDLSVWIFLPAQVAVSVSADGVKYDKMIILSSKIPLTQRGPLVENYVAGFGQATARFIRVEARNIGVCPDWHSGAGKEAWVFIDEVVVE